MKKLLILSLLLASQPALANDITFQFKNPSFSGNGAGAQWLTIENQEFNRRKAIRDEIEAELKARATEERNSILNRFMNNLQSRIYSQLASQLTDNLFSNESARGTFRLDKNTIEYEKGANSVKLRITDESGNVTEIEIPLSGFSF
ncbi:Type VIII secretion system, CsgF [uncultured Caudovirales phage]|uniref:Type VIII secretion system, CsgF n=1 Tax=uncultured Caudovirales phage TaxID=2100421 RepID=A0A6J5MFA1_9CAUD|nr:Type VIII secretion system, CsgF [uncultured Caudovirales phage]